ncbi:MAG: hypothetical protein FWG89_01710, partial [Treponema sp.]|nr:hypothetical protein [Treponema sp.]
MKLLNKPFGIIVLFSLLIGSCDLFQPNNPNYYQELLDEVAWSNADRLAVTFHAPEGWINSSTPSLSLAAIPLTVIDIRRGSTSAYNFSLECEPSAAYGFEQWLAFETAFYNSLSASDRDKSAAEMQEHSLIGASVTLVEEQVNGANRRATFRIDTVTPITIVPWCSNRPSLDQRTNPPINPILTPFPYDQRINIWFTMPIKTSTVSLTGESPTIRVTGIWASGNERGQPFNMNGENGDLQNYFDIEFPPPPDPTKPLVNNRVNLIPKANAFEIALLTVTVTVGPGIESESGVAMTTPALISYQTDTTEARKVYRAGNVRASESSASGYFRDAEFSRPDIDRRFTQNTNNTKNTVYIRFTVEAPEDAPDSNPNKIIIVERRLFSLRGFDLNPGSTNETTYLYPGPGVSLAGGEFTITHTLETALSGIVQLAVLPWYDGSPAVEEMPVNEAVSEGRYVTVVMDNAAPDVENPLPALTGQSSMDNGVYVYGTGVAMTLTLNGLSGIVDNGGEGGIAASRAYSLPWTMDESDALIWHAMIGVNAATETITMPKQSVNTNTWTLANLSALVEGTEYRVYVKYEDTLGNITPNWTATGLRVMYSTAVKETVTGIKAYCNTNGDGITISWDEPSGWTSAVGTYPYPEIVITTYRASASGDIEEGTQTITRSRGAGAYSFTVPQIVFNRVREGEAVSNVYGYKISVVTQNIAGPMTAGPIWVYNIPDMATAESVITTGGVMYLPLEHLTGTISGSLLSGNKNFVLANSNIVLTDHDPNFTFTGNFYGNGHTVTITGMSTAADMGLFGVVNGGTVRDLTVMYETATGGAVTVTRTGEAQFGGMAGTVQGTARLENVLVKGAISVSGNNNIFAGGLVGLMGRTAHCTASINNAYSGLNLTVFKTAGTNAQTGNAYIGGIAGSMGNPNPSTATTIAGGGNPNAIGSAVRVEKARVVGDITAGSSDTPFIGISGIPGRLGTHLGIKLGGLVGHIYGAGNGNLRAVLNDCDYRQGSIRI